ncbi:MAG: signal peptidase I [Candidatus Woesearchaeota archaeon]
MAVKEKLKKLWWFIWEDDSVLSWIVNIVLAFVVIKFVVFPGLGWILGTNYPIVAVVSDSMEHSGSFDSWWSIHEKFYNNLVISKEDFIEYRFANGFNKGDIMILRGVQPEDVQIGDVIVFRNSQPDPIIHRVVKRWTVNGTYHFQTKGDKNLASIPFSHVNEIDIVEERVVGRAALRIPIVGYIKIWAFDLFKLIVGGVQRVLS